MNALQQTEFNILQSFVEVCEALKLKYYLVCGSALGAVKYGGFIPWDDDIDVAMPREDYERFIRSAGRYLPDNLFIQNYSTDPAVPIIYTKIRNSDTAYIEKSVADLPINHGVYIDVFPLDGYPRSRVNGAVLELRKRFYKYQLASATQAERNLKSLIHYSFFKIIGSDHRTAKTASRYTRMISSSPTRGSALWCNHGNRQGKTEYAPYEQYGEGHKALFEGLSVIIPQRYDEYLTQKYGDWRADLPEEEKKGHHYYTVCDLERPYTMYTNR